MAFDGGFLHKILNELKIAIDCHIYKIYQPCKDELVFLLRKKGFSKRLFITIKPGSARIHFTENKFENPDTPPNFCMLLRKYLSASKLVDVQQHGLERVIELKFSTCNELGDVINLRLVCEFIGNQANVILLGNDGIIIDALHRSDVETAQRFILPGALYEYPPCQQKQNIINCDIKNLAKHICCKGGEIWKNVIASVEGLSPLVCREIEFLVEQRVKLGINTEKAVEQVLFELREHLTNKNIAIVLLKPDGSLWDFSFIFIFQYGEGYKNKEYSGYSELLDAFYTEKDITKKINTAAHDMIKLLNNLKQRTQKRLELRLNELRGCANREELRIWGELLKANLYQIDKGSSFVVVKNYYDENLSEIKIPLNPALSPAKNAEKYFKDYKKSYVAEHTLKLLTENDKKELIYLDSVLNNISHAKTLAEISEIREELIEAHYIKKTNISKKKKTSPISFREEISCEGYRILIGKNNIQNDYLTTKLAEKNDLWFHTKNIPGSHVLVLCKGKDVSDETILKAALFAAKNSAASNSSQVAVDYTPVKNVKKPSGAKPGMVIYTTNKTVYVNPLEEANK